ncbi:hypothetical protein NPIL_305891 [Nephila pilipes]|uniref:Uncharacterized protein n=1 Tax=Nephila pilipes TaxID=299642 RepID=A0A8X6NSD7_NEPPI|nr:hypothetical protein NPIL_305891 [Nephila pilipes]
MPTHTFSEISSWTARGLVACGFSSDNIWVFCDLNTSSQVKVNSPVNKTEPEKRRYFAQISKQQREIVEQNRLRKPVRFQSITGDTLVLALLCPAYHREYAP